MTRYKEVDSDADTSQKAVLPINKFAFFGWNYSIRGFIHPLNTEDPSTDKYSQVLQDEV